MHVKLEKDLSVQGIEIYIKYAEMNKDVERIATMLQSISTRIKCMGEDSEKFTNLADIYYFESVDKVTFAYCEKEVYRTDLRLYQIVDDFAHLGFVQISRACVLNINFLDSITPLLNSRMEATLHNSERLYVTRKYLKDIKLALQEGMQK